MHPSQPNDPGALPPRQDRSPSTPPSSMDGTTTPANPPSGPFTPGQILGNRYRFVRLLGRGGMGEVWQAYDLKLQVDVALKSIRPGRFSDDQGLELLRREVRAAREVISPNVCRIFDLVEEEGQEFVSMEYIDGRTLLDILLERGPLELQEATRIASQFLSGLEAIHQAGLVHRDVKPENIMITRTGRVALMDFGIAKGIADDRRRTIAGTPAYMAPEQLRGEKLDARADIFAAGVVLAEMCAPGGIREESSRGWIWRAVRQAPVKLFESPWRGVLERAVSSEPSRRYESARALARALEEVTLRVEGAEDKRPYPGLESFTAADAEFFFGREVEVEAVWKKLQRANLLAIIGPSGAGKTSFLQAGLLPAEPAGWRHVVLRPGSSPFVALGHALVAELAGDPDAIRELVEIERPEHALAAVGRWRSQSNQVLIVVDQCEELFTLCEPDTQVTFADLLGRLAAQADVHVLLVMRDDFLFHCHGHPRLASITSDLTLLGPPTGPALRRALVQPALLCGYRFEDESLADEMLAAIEGERGALPMLAFTAARLWEDRNRVNGLLTREAYERIGGVSGALAQHAETTLERIGNERQPIVRELFRNLVTAQGTRAIADVDELLSVFPDRAAAGEVLRELIDARLLTSFELPAGREGGHEVRRVEIVHESLLSSWPRLVRWQTQDTEGAQLRDQLRQAAQAWKERHESEDLLWTGTAYEEFRLWRQRYPGGLTATEEAFATAMIEKAGRQRRRRQRLVAATIAALALVAIGLTGLWLRAQVAQRRSEASRLLALGRNELEADPTAALAYAIRSLELTDGAVGRRFALEALSQGPIAHRVRLPELFRASSFSFSPDGTRLAVGGERGVLVFSQDGSPPIVVEDNRDGASLRGAQFGPDGDKVVFRSWPQSLVRVWSLSAGKEIRRFQLEGTTLTLVRKDRLFLLTSPAGVTANIDIAYCTLLPGLSYFAKTTVQWNQAVLRTWAFDDGEPVVAGRWNLEGVTSFDIDPDGRRAAYTKGHGVYICPTTEVATDHDRLIGEHAHQTSRVAFDAEGVRLASADSSGEVLIWPLSGEARRPSRKIAVETPVWGLWFDPTGARLAVCSGPDKNINLWELNGPSGADPVALRNRLGINYAGMAFDPSGQWLVSAPGEELSFWPNAPPNPYVLKAGNVATMADFIPDGKSLLVAAGDGSIETWGLEDGAVRRVRQPGKVLSWMKLDPLGRFAALAISSRGGATLISLGDWRERQLPDTSQFTTMWDITVSADGRLVVSTDVDRTGIRVWDLESDSYRVLESSKGKDLYTLAASTDGRVFAGDKGGGDVWEFDLKNDTCASTGRMSFPLITLLVTPDNRFLLVMANEDRSELIRYDLEKRTSVPITTHGNRLCVAALDPTGKLLATGDMDGIVRVGPIMGGPPHMFFGGRDLRNVAVDPSGRWIAGGSMTSSAVLLWRIPEGPPPQTLSRNEFLEWLRAWTNVRAEPDPASSTGYGLEEAAFRGWNAPAGR